MVQTPNNMGIRNCLLPGVGTMARLHVKKKENREYQKITSPGCLQKPLILSLGMQVKLPRPHSSLTPIKTPVGRAQISGSGWTSQSTMLLSPLFKDSGQVTSSSSDWASVNFPICRIVRLDLLLLPHALWNSKALDSCHWDDPGLVRKYRDELTKWVPHCLFD